MTRPRSRSLWSRRRALQLGGGLLSLPVLQGLAARPARAAIGAAPKRLIVLHTGQGCVLPMHTPVGSSASFTLPYGLEPLAHLQDRMVVVSGLDNRAASLNSVGNAHQQANLSAFTGQPYAVQDTSRLSAGGPSFEQLLTERIAGDTPFGRIDLAVGGGGAAGFYTTDRFYAGPYDPIVSMNDPFVALTRIFGDGGISPADAWALRARRASVLDAVSDQLRLLRPRLDAEAKLRLDAHADKLQALEARVIAGLGECGRPAFATPAGYDYTYDDDVSVELMVDILVSAMSCDYARVGTIELTNTHDHAFPWLWAENGGPIFETSVWDNWHLMVHADYQPGMEVVYRWYMSVLASLLDRLADTEDADGDNMLDGTLVLWMPEFSSGRHWVRNLPAVLAGHLGAGSGGRWLDFLPLPADELHARPDGGYVDGGATTQQLFTSILQIFGGSDGHFGVVDPSAPPGPLPGL